MRGIVFDPTTQTLEFKDGSRTTYSAAGTMVSLLPTVETFMEHEVAFPDVPKGRWWAWWSSARLAFGTLGQREGCGSYLTAMAQEFGDKLVLADAPVGADFFMGQIRLSRTVAPSHTWVNRTLGVLPPEDVWFQITGSCLVEADLNFARAIHVYIDDDPLSDSYRKLVLEWQQTVGPASGGYTTEIADAVSSSWRTHLQAVNGNGNASSGGNGMPIYFLGGYGYGPVNSSFGGSILGSGQILTTLRHNGSNPNKPTTSDPTNYSSTYVVDVRGRFGRRS